MTVPYRIDEAITRHGPDSPNALGQGRPRTLPAGVADRVEQRLTAHRRK